MSPVDASATKLPADHQNRIDALNPKRSVCVTAPAGSGKTELLSQRVLQLLAAVDQPEEILAITFTRKAAAEMHHRIMAALAFANNQEQPAEPHKLLSWSLARRALKRNQQQGWHLLENPGRLKVQTIDSLCASLTRQMPVLSNFGAQPKITDNAEACYQQAIQNLLGQLETNTAIANPLCELLSHIDNDFARLQRLLAVMLQRRDQWLLHIGVGIDANSELLAARQKLEKTLTHIISDSLTVIAKKLAPAAPQLVPLLDYAGCNLRWQHSESPIAELAGCIELPAATVEALPQWQGIIDLLLVKSPKVNFRKRLDKNSGFPTETRDGDKQLAKRLKQQMTEQLAGMAEDSNLLTALAEFLSLPAPGYAENQWHLLNALIQLLPTLVAELTLVFQQQGTVDYTQIALAALDSLGDSLDPTELALRLDHRLCHILIDEFQDTSSTQFRLLEKLTNGWAEHNESNSDLPNTLFLVGDGMQSIYGFREANVGLFLEARKFGINGLHLDDLPLTVNFRSDPCVVEWNNQVFAQAFPPVENLARGAVPYERASAFNAESESSGVAVIGFTGTEARVQEACYIADVIMQLQNTDPDDSIAVLVRSRNHLQALIAEMARRNMAWNATDIDSLSSYACIQDLLSLTRAVSNFADRTSWAALLRAPWFGLSNADLHCLFNHGSGLSSWSLLRSWEELGDRLSTFARDRLAVQIPKLEAALLQRQRINFREWLEGLWMMLGGAAGLQDNREFDMVDSYFDVLEHYQSAGVIPSLTDFEHAVVKLYARPQSADSKLHLMTIHKSKGLEFDTVILPGLARSPRSEDRALMMWREYLSPEGNYPEMVICPLPAAGESDKVYDHLRFEQAQAQILENTRLLYVAATRAVKRLYLSFTTEFDDNTNAAKSPAKGSLLANAWPAVNEQVNWQVPVVAAQDQMTLGFGEAKNYSLFNRLATSWKAPTWSFPNPLAPFYLNADFAGENVPALQLDPVPGAVGTVVHTVFETIARFGPDYWKSMPAEQVRQWVLALLRAQGITVNQCANGLPQVLTAVNNTLGTTRGQWLLSPGSNGKKDFTELAVSSCVEGNIRHRIVDRILYDEQGTLWVVDYKTGQPFAGESRQQFIDRECKQYRAQLLDYRWHINQLMNAEGNIRLALFFTSIPLFQEVIPGKTESEC